MKEGASPVFTAVTSKQLSFSGRSGKSREKKFDLTRFPGESVGGLTLRSPHASASACFA
jgi:hypothetical protein